MYVVYQLGVNSALKFPEDKKIKDLSVELWESK